jgi:hypothetical protein
MVPIIREKRTLPTASVRRDGAPMHRESLCGVSVASPFRLSPANRWLISDQVHFSSLISHGITTGDFIYPFIFADPVGKRPPVHQRSGMYT